MWAGDGGAAASSRAHCGLVDVLVARMFAAAAWRHRPLHVHPGLGVRAAAQQAGQPPVHTLTPR